MPDLSQTATDEKVKALELFKRAGYDKDDLDYFYATSTYIRSKFHGSDYRLFLAPVDFIDFCNTLERMGYHKSFRQYLQNFVQLYFDGKSWGLRGICGEKSVMLNWRDNYSRTKHSKAETRDTSYAEKNILKTEIVPVPERKHIMLLAIEISRLHPQLLEKIQSGSVTIADSDLQDFYRLPWIWHYGPGELQDIKAMLASELAVPEQDADSLIIGTMLNPAPGIRITPEIKGSEMRAVFEKLDGKTLKLLCDFRMADLGRSSVKFYRMP